MAEITDQVPGQETLDDEIQHEQQDDEVPPIPDQEVVPPEPEFVSETLYIQNLNDKVKLPCELYTGISTHQPLIVCYRYEGNSEQSFPSLRKGY